MKQIYLQTTINYMFQVDPEGSQQLFEQMGIEPQMNEIELSNSEPIRYYVYDLKE
jgi:hypothetical protein